MMNERRAAPGTQRSTFASLARAAVEKHVPESRTGSAHWSFRPNAIAVRWALDGAGFAYIGLYRHLDWLSGEAGFSREPHELADLFPLPGAPAGPVAGYRIRLGFLLEGEDRWWSAGADERALIERFEWMALQLRVRGEAYFRRHGEDQ